MTALIFFPPPTRPPPARPINIHWYSSDQSFIPVIFHVFYFILIHSLRIKVDSTSAILPFMLRIEDSFFIPDGFDSTPFTSLNYFPNNVLNHLDPLKQLINHSEQLTIQYDVA